MRTAKKKKNITKNVINCSPDSVKVLFRVVKKPCEEVSVVQSRSDFTAKNLSEEAVIQDKTNLCAYK